MPVKTKLILGALALAVVAMLVIFGHEPSGSSPRDTCPSEGIDPTAHKEGTCYVGDTKTVVVDRDDHLRLETLEAKLRGIRESATLSGPQGVKSARGVFETFDLAITNRTDAPARVGENQAVLLVGEAHGEDVEAEADYEPDSFLSRGTEIPPGSTAEGSVTFDISRDGAKVLATKGNLDLGNFGVGGSDYEPEQVLSEPEVGVIRTYSKPER